MHMRYFRVIPMPNQTGVGEEATREAKPAMSNVISKQCGQQDTAISTCSHLYYT
jgi:hypothetical protein